jgi:AcrR family transcriptional regulator
VSTSDPKTERLPAVLDRAKACWVATRFALPPAAACLKGHFKAGITLNLQIFSKISESAPDIRGMATKGNGSPGGIPIAAPARENPGERVLVGHRIDMKYREGIRKALIISPQQCSHCFQCQTFVLIPSLLLKTSSPKKPSPVIDHGRRTVVDYASPTVARILDAAESLFADNCFAGTRIDDIAAMAGVNKATLYYHIGGKEKIYEIVLFRHVKTFADGLEKRLEGLDDPVEALLEVVRHHAEAAIANDRASRTVAHELAGGSHRMTPAIVAEYARVYAATVRVMSAGAASGHLKKVNPSLAHLLLAGPLFVSAINRPSRSLLFGHALLQGQTKPSLEELAAFLEQVVRDFLAFPPQA